MLISRPGGGHEHAYLCDFGLAKHASTVSSLTGSREILGTFDYLAPEQIEGKPVDGRVDVYAPGCVLYECLTGDPPYERDSEIASLLAHVNDPPPARRALRFGVGLQRAVDEEKLPRPVGIGLDAGEATPVEGGFRGGALNRAARLCSRGIPAPQSCSGAQSSRATPAREDRSGGRAYRRSRRPRSSRRQPGATWVRLQLGGRRPVDDRAGLRVDCRNEPPVDVVIVPGGGAVWVANANAGTVTRIDPVTDRTQSFHVGHRPRGLAVVDNRVLVSLGLSAEDARSRIVGSRVLRAAVLGDRVPTTDSGSSTDYIDVLAVRYATGAGLMAYSVGASGLATVVPEIAGGDGREPAVLDRVGAKTGRLLPIHL
jgi:hypothetical protein